MSDQKMTPEARLIQQAGRIFAKSGPSATVREICKAAECSVAAVNYHFGDKQNLYLRCVREALEVKQKLFPMPELPNGEDLTPSKAADLLRTFLRAMNKRISGISDQSDLSWHNTLMLREIISPSEGVGELMSEPFKPRLVRPNASPPGAVRRIRKRAASPQICDPNLGSLHVFPHRKISSKYV